MKQTMIQQISRGGSKSSSKARSVGGEMNEFPKNPVSCQPLTDRRPKSSKTEEGYSDRRPLRRYISVGWFVLQRGIPIDLYFLKSCK